MFIPKVQLGIIGGLLRERRTGSGITLRAVAAVAQCDPMTVLRVERGCIGRLATISKVTDAVEALAAERQQSYKRHLEEAIQLHHAGAAQ